MELSPEAASRLRVQSYGESPAIDGLETIELRRFHDDGGSMTELLRLDRGSVDAVPGFVPAQVNYSCLQPGVIKAFHVHRRQSDVWFVPPEDRVLLVVVDVRAGSPTEGNVRRVMLGDSTSRLVRIPPGVAHGCRNLGSQAARILYFTDVHFSPDPEACDEGRLPWDLFGAAVWEVAPE